MQSRIGLLIKMKGLRKGYVAEYIGVNPNTVSNWIKGVSYPKLDQAYKLAKLLDCQLDDLIQE